MKKLWLIILGIVIIISGCQKTETKKISIGVNDWPPCEVWYIAQEQGYFDGLNVEINRFSNWTDNMNSLYFGTTDITHATYFNSVYLADKGESGKIMMPIDTIIGSDGLVVEKNIENIEDLRGKKVAVEIGTDEHFLLAKSLESVNLSMSDVDIVSSTSKESKDLLVSGEVSGAFTYEPYLSMAKNESNGNVLFTTADLPDYMVDVLVVRENALENREDEFKKIVEAWYKAVDYIKENPDKSFELMAKNENMSKENFESFFNSFKFYSANEAKDIMDSKELQSKLLEMNDFSIENNLINDNIDIQKILDTDLLRVNK